MGCLRMDEIKTIQEENPEYNNIKIFIESGTFLGDTVYPLSFFFDRLYTIEIKTDLHEKAKETFKKMGITNVSFHLGDSAHVLQKILEEVTQPAVFFLDGHYSHGITGRGEKDCPLLEELDAVNKYYNEKSIIIVDDYSMFGKNETENWTEITDQNVMKCFDPAKIYKVFSNNNRLIILLKKV